MNSQIIPDNMVIDELSNYVNTIFLHRHQLNEESHS